MIRRTPHSEDDSQLDAPRVLRDDFALLYGSEVPVPPQVDAAILAMARQHMARRRRVWGGLRRVGLIGTAAAAAVGLAVLVWRPWQAQTDRPAAPLAVSAAPLDPKDIDRNGRVDILDAFSLARQVEAGGQLQGTQDVNGDGVIDAKDVDAVAMAAVSLKGGAS